MIRLTRWDLSLLLALLLVGAASVSMRRAAAPEPPAAAPVSWKNQEQAARQKIQAVMALKPEVLQQRIQSRPELSWRFRLGSIGTTLILAGVLFSLLRVLWLLILRRPLVSMLGSPPPAIWGGRFLLRLILGLLLLTQVAGLFEGWLLRGVRPGWLDRQVLVVAHTLFVDGTVLAVGGWFLSRAARRRAAPQAGWVASARFAVGSYLTFLPVLVGIVMLVASVLNALRYEPAPQPVFTLFLSETRRGVVLLLLFLATVVGPIAEEVFFRGLLYGWLRARLGIGQALVATAFLFACLHTDPVSFFPIFGLGLLFGWTYEKTGSLAAPLTIHVLHNAGMLYIAFLIRTLASVAS